MTSVAATNHTLARPRLTSGRIAYRDGGGAEIGRERFEIVSHHDGHVLRAFCEMDDIGLLRDVTIALDCGWRPLDGFCRITKGGHVAATTWFGVEPGAVLVEGFVAGVGRLSQRLQTDASLAYLGLHPVQGDALIVEARGEANPGVFVTVAAITNSISPNGDEGLTGMSIDIDVAFIGHETITVAAGTFAARRFALRWHPDWPTADLWVRQADCAFLLMRWSMIANWFELTNIEDI
jgi:hypothetical protein